MYNARPSGVRDSKEVTKTLMLQSATGLPLDEAYIRSTVKTFGKVTRCRINGSVAMVEFDRHTSVLAAVKGMNGSELPSGNGSVVARAAPPRCCHVCGSQQHQKHRCPEMLRQRLARQEPSTDASTSGPPASVLNDPLSPSSSNPLFQSVAAVVASLQVPSSLLTASAKLCVACGGADFRCCSCVLSAIPTVLSEAIVAACRESTGSVSSTVPPSAYAAAAAPPPRNPSPPAVASPALPAGGPSALRGASQPTVPASAPVAPIYNPFGSGGGLGGGFGYSGAGAFASGLLDSRSATANSIVNPQPRSDPMAAADSVGGGGVNNVMGSYGARPGADSATASYGSWFSGGPSVSPKASASLGASGGTPATPAGSSLLGLLSTAPATSAAAARAPPPAAAPPSLAPTSPSLPPSADPYRNMPNSSATASAEKPAEGGLQLFLGGVPTQATVQDLTTLCKQYGPVSSVVKRPGFAFVHFGDDAVTATAAKMLNGATFRGKTIRAQVQPVKFTKAKS